MGAEKSLKLLYSIMNLNSHILALARPITNTLLSSRPKQMIKTRCQLVNWELTKNIPLQTKVTNSSQQMTITPF
jgi:hypothetical protein